MTSPDRRTTKIDPRCATQFLVHHASWKMQRRENVVKTSYKGVPLDAARPRIAICVESSAGHVLAVTVSGDLDMSTGPLFHQQICAMLEQSHGRRLELDLSRVDFCDLAGLRAIYAVAESAAKARHLTCVTASAPSLDTVLQLCQITEMFGYSTPRQM